MIKPYVITLSQVKAYLGISATTYDTQINLYIPDVTDDLTRPQGICNQSFLLEGTADTDGTVTLSNVSIDYSDLYEGSCIYINGEDGVIVSYDEDASTVTLTDALTKTATGQALIIRNFPVGAKQTVAKMVMSKIGQTTTNTDGIKDVKSKSIGPVSVTFSGGTQNDTMDRFGYPESLTKALKTIRRMRFV